MDRRKFVNTMGLGLAVTAIPAKLLAKQGAEPSLIINEEFEGHNFPELPYSYDALEPYIDKMTMEIHYDRHYRSYFNKFLESIRYSDAENMSMPEIFSKMSSYSTAVKNNGGGFYNHTLFWNNMSPVKSKPSEKLVEAINLTFGSFDEFKKSFNSAAATRFGSGWAWLILTPEKQLAVTSTANQDNPLMNTSDIKGYPLLALDVWEHAYYLNYQNKRGEYIAAFWNVINWDEVNRRFLEALKI